MFSLKRSHGKPSAGAARAGTVVTIREALPADAPELRRIAALDSARPPAGPTLVADVGGEIVAALPRDGGRPIADPFQPTADLVRLLELRAGQLARNAQARSPERVSPRAAPRTA